MRAALDPLTVAKQRRGERERGGALTDARRAVEEVGVDRALPEGGEQEALGLVLLEEMVEALHRHSCIVRRRA